MKIATSISVCNTFKIKSKQIANNAFLLYLNNLLYSSKIYLLDIFS